MSPSAFEIARPEVAPAPSRKGRVHPASSSPSSNLRIAHLLRKCNPAEWGGTETAIQRLCEGLNQHGITSVVYCPQLESVFEANPLTNAGCTVKRFRTCVPVWGLSAERRRQLIAVGGNLLSFELVRSLWQEPGLSVIHTHAMGRLGGIALTVARRRKLPFVVTIHGGALDVPEQLKTSFQQSSGGFEWGKAFGFLLRSHRLFTDADAILTCNPNEAALLREQHPSRRIVVQPHGVTVARYRPNQREAALNAFPALRHRDVLLCVGRVDSIKNQRWLVEEAPALFRSHPKALLVLAGACTDAAYGEALQDRIAKLGLNDRILLTGGLPPNDPRLLGLMQVARAVVLSSISETFGLVLLEAWASGTSVIASRTSGATALIKQEQNGWLFDLGEPGTFHRAVDDLFKNPDRARQMAAQGFQMVESEYDNSVLAGRMRRLYEQLIEEKHALRHSPR